VSLEKTPSGKSLQQMEVATLGGGCFWCMEAVFTEVKSVTKVESGYSGGQLANPTYEQVSTGTMGHAEVVQVTFNPDVVSFREVLEIFFAMHNPTTLNRQGSDVGTQYRSLILYHTREQRAIAKRLIKELTDANAYDAAIVTQVEPFEAFYKSEDQHKDYFRHHADQPYCRLVIAPKIAKLRKKYREKLKPR
jgi:peptide-methionine (S)-S-oxide reductase